MIKLFFFITVLALMTVYILSNNIDVSTEPRLVSSETHCTKYEIYKKCGDQCTKACISYRKNCGKCTAGCYCKKDFLRAYYNGPCTRICPEILRSKKNPWIYKKKPFDLTTNESSFTNKPAIIMTYDRNYVLGSTDKLVTLQKKQYTKEQLWTFRPAGIARQFIVNVKLDKNNETQVLDIQNGIYENSWIITFHIKTADNNHNQVWYLNSDHTIATFNGSLALEVWNGHFAEGERLVAAKINTNSIYQKFYLEFEPRGYRWH